jgi:hypothetical protein
MNKKNLFLKVFNNLSKFEIYFSEQYHSQLKTLPVDIIINGRTFSGRYNATITKQKIINFNEDVNKFINKVEKGNLKEIIFINGNYNSFKIEINAISETKIIWKITLQPFIEDIEHLYLKIETEMNLLNSIGKRILKLK